MRCAALDSFYLKANGEVCCWCSPGEHHPFLRLDAERVARTDIVEEVLNGRAFRLMRRRMAEDELPFGFCESCCHLDREGDYPSADIDRGAWTLSGRLRCLQVEPSFLCNVDCPLCVPLRERKSAKPPPYHLDPAVWRKVVDDLAAHRFSVETVYYSGRGEPLLHPDFPALVRYAKDRLGGFHWLDTNGNFRFRPDLVGCGLDEVHIAFDGVTQEAYERYRRGGRLERVLRFARDFASARNAAGLQSPRLVWKMVLFEWNSSNEELERAFELAAEAGLDEVLLHDTDTPGGVSYRNDGRRVREIEGWLENAREALPLPVKLEAYASTYRHLPEVEVALRCEREASNEERLVFLGRLFNVLLEPRSVEVLLLVEDEHGEWRREVARARFDLPPRSEHVESFALPTDGLPDGRLRLVAVVRDPETGVELDHAQARFRRDAARTASP